MTKAKWMAVLATGAAFFGLLAAGAKVAGTVDYTSQTDISVAPGATVGGKNY